MNTHAIILPSTKSTQNSHFLQVGGLSLLERCIKSLAKCGVTQFYWIQEDQDALRPHPSTISPNLKKFNILPISVQDLHSLEIQTSLCVTTTNFVMPTKSYTQFFDLAKDQPSSNHSIVGQDKQTYLGYVQSLKDIKFENNRFSILESRNIENAEQYNLATVNEKKDIPKAEKTLLQSLRKPTDGWISKNINRYISLWASIRLAAIGMHPNLITTLVFIVSMYGAYLAAKPSYVSILVGGLLFQICSIFDGCDGEVSRLRLQSSAFGAWYDTITDNIRYAAFIVALAYHGFALTGVSLYLWAVVFFVITLIYLIFIMIRYEKSVNAGTHLVVTLKVESEIDTMPTFLRRFILPLRGLIKQDVSAFVIMLFCMLGIGHYFIWVACIVLTFMTIIVSKSLLFGQKPTTYS